MTKASFQSHQDWYVYMVQCQDGSLYTGVCTDVKRRLLEHNYNDKKAARYTRSRRPVTLRYQENCENRSHACQREAAIKKLNRQQKILLIESAPT